MSEAPRRIASIISLLTKRTIGRVFHIVAADLLIELIVTATDLESLEIDAFLIGEPGHLRIVLLDRLVDGLLQLVVLDDDRLDTEASLELDLIDRMQVGRVGDRQEQALASLEERQDPMFRQQLVTDQTNRVEIEVDRIQIEERHTEFVGSRDGDVTRRRRTAGDQLSDDRGLALACRVQRLVHRGLFHDAVLHQPLRKTPEAGAGIGCGRGVITHGVG